MSIIMMSDIYEKKNIPQINLCSYWDNSNNEFFRIGCDYYK